MKNLPTFTELKSFFRFVRRHRGHIRNIPAYLDSKIPFKELFGTRMAADVDWFYPKYNTGMPLIAEVTYDRFNPGLYKGPQAKGQYRGIYDSIVYSAFTAFHIQLGENGEPLRVTMGFRKLCDTNWKVEWQEIPLFTLKRVTGLCNKGIVRHPTIWHGEKDSVGMLLSLEAGRKKASN